MSEADQMAAPIPANGGEARHLVANNEGNGFATKEHSDYAIRSVLDSRKRTLLAE